MDDRVLAYFPRTQADFKAAGKGGGVRLTIEFSESDADTAYQLWRRGSMPGVLLDLSDVRIVEAPPGWEDDGEAPDEYSD